MTDTLPVALTPMLTEAQKTTLINLIRRTAKTELLPRFGRTSGQDIFTKSGPMDLVTEADTEAEHVLARGIQRLFPHALIVGEEAASRDPSLTSKIQDAELAFILDPLDGTWNFAHGLALFGMIVSVTRFGKPVLGILYDPKADDWMIADITSRSQRETPISCGRLLAVSKKRNIAEMTGYIDPFLMSHQEREKLLPTFSDFGRVMTLRSSCHEYRMLARGSADFILTSAHPHPWDHLAGVLVCQQAGGIAAMLDGRAYDASVSKGHILVAPNQESWDTLRDHFSGLLGDTA